MRVVFTKHTKIIICHTNVPIGFVDFNLVKMPYLAERMSQNIFFINTEKKIAIEVFFTLFFLIPFNFSIQFQLFSIFLETVEPFLPTLPNLTTPFLPQDNIITLSFYSRFQYCITFDFFDTYTDLLNAYRNFQNCNLSIDKQSFYIIYIVLSGFSAVSIMFLPRFQMWFDASGRAYVSLAARYDPLRK